ncbi:Hint domain-containing protein [Paracoccus sp. MKU1]|uniref:Hint domain-containing protein n=1 Tax=Paracoccus sp. MKU1 TaxID=1745182 RepID=UPI0007EF94A4|nr:Hint domain-containing protein [Paracoccus sp. MKU1]
MPYFTEIPSSLITVGVDGVVAFVPDTALLNAFGASQEFAQYDVDDTSATTLQNGDSVTPVNASGTPLTSNPGTYLGSMTLSNAAVGANIPLVGDLTLQVNPVDGHLMSTTDPDTGETTYYIITEQPLDADNLTVDVDLVGPLGVALIDETVNLSGVVNLLSGVVGPGVVNDLLNDVIVTMDHDPDGTLDLTDDEVFVCFVAGTLIETEGGFIPVEALKAGDLVVTRDNGLQPIRWIGSVRLNAARLQAQPKLRAIRIKAGVLGPNTPSSDLLVSPQHRVLVRSKIAMRMFGAMEVLVAAKQLLQIDGVDIAEDLAEIEYFHLLFERHEVVNSNGAASESLYTGAQALKSLGRAAREEILALFPQLRDADFRPEAARQLPSGRQSRKLAVRHAQHGRPLVQHA